jgi:uncharacterized protein
LRPSKPFSLLVKPASADCNLRCTYCFYLDKGSLYPETSQHRMSDEVLEAMISSFMAVDQDVYSIGWQGGEPTLMGTDFFRKVVELEERYGRRGAVVANGLQTNATLIDDDLASLLARYRFLVGVSIDGPQDIHDCFRKRSDGTGSHSSVLRGIERLRRNKVEFNGLVLVSSANVGRAREVYNYLCDLGIYYHQYIPCVEFDESGSLLPFAITGKQWGEFLCAVFDEWVSRDVHRVSIRDFDSVINFMVNHTYSVCTMSGRCDHYFVVEHNGDVYPCDFFVERDRRLGNVLSDDLVLLQSSPLLGEFASMKAQWDASCSCCRYLALCSGDCPKQRVHVGSHQPTRSWLCEGWLKFLDHSIKEFERIALSVINSGQHPLRKQGSITYPTPGRNDVCFCGSGRKYKRCHGAHH